MYTYYTSPSHLASAVYIHPIIDKEDHILQTAFLTCPHQSLRHLIYMLVEKSTELDRNCVCNHIPHSFVN